MRWPTRLRTGSGASSSKNPAEAGWGWRGSAERLAGPFFYDSVSSWPIDAIGEHIEFAANKSEMGKIIRAQIILDFFIIKVSMSFFIIAN